MTVVLNKSHDKVFVWNDKDICKLRQEHHIVGHLVGCLPRCPQQNIQLGVPLQLMKEETTLLLEKSIARLLADSGQLTVPTPAEVQSFSDYRNKSYEEQVIICKRARRAEMLQHLPEIIDGRRRVGCSRSKQRKVELESGETIAEPISTDEELISIDDVAPISERQALIHLLTKNPRERAEERLEWSYPTTDTETLRYRVFKHFWETGHYLTCGAKFGADFLVYEGDPSRFHAPFMAVCVGYQQTLSPQEIVTLGRLGTNVKKTPVLCSIDANSELCFTSIQWSRLK